MRLSLVLGVVVALALMGCEDDPVGPMDTGTLEIEVATTGEDLDSDGYTVDFDNGASILAIAVDGSTSITAEPGDYTVLLANVASNCAVDGDNPRTVTIEAEASETVSFSVTCTASQ